MSNLKKQLPQLKSKQSNHRQQRVAEEIRHMLAEILTRGDIGTAKLDNVFVTITHVELSNDLRNAKIFITPLGKLHDGHKVASLFNKHQATIRFQMAKKLQLKNVPMFLFNYDESLDRAERMDALISKVITADSD